MTVGIVAVSHSLPLAEAARDLALQMISGEAPPLKVAAGTPDGGFGTDAVAVSEAITEVDNGDGVLVLVDLGSAILSAEMALEFLPDPDANVQVISAPFVEGLLAATVRAATGGTLEEVANEARAALAPKQDQLGDAAPAKSSNDADGAAASVADVEIFDAKKIVALINPNGLHARPASKIAGLVSEFDAKIQIRSAAGKSAAALSPLAVAGLGTKGGENVELLANGPDAAVAVEKLAELISAGFGEVEPASSGAEISPEKSAAGDSPATKPAARKPLGVSAGRVVGKVLRMPEPITAPAAGSPILAAERDAAVSRLKDAVAQVIAELQARADAATGHSHDILAATAQLAADPMIVDDASKQISETGTAPEKAVWEVLDDVATQYEAAGGALAERATDVRNVRARIVAALTGQKLPEVPQSDSPFILVAKDLAPADTAQLNPKTCLGMVLGEGGPTSHTAILARTFGIAAVVDAASFEALSDGDTVLVDGSEGAVIVNPSDDEAATARREPQLLTELPPFEGPGQLASGEEIAIIANVGGAKDVALAVERGAEGVGLFRTEFCFLGRQTAPSFDEQVKAYSEVFAGFPGKKVVVRTLDAGSDKPLPFVTPAHEENPALGVRGLRTCWDHPEVLETQLAAIAAAAKATDAQPWVMAPMVATIEEAKTFVKTARAQGLTANSGAKLGVMVETPAAAVQTAELFKVLDFVSIGTNDLTQYTMAADRMATELAHLNTPWQPAVLRLIGQIGAGANGGSVGVCGEAAADPLLAPVLVGLGVNSLSMTATAIPLVGAQIAKFDLATCKAAAEAACAAESASDARAAAAQVLQSAK